ncbi:ATP-binding cassette domain-containing protein [Pseudidiomarina sp. 1APP75-32.1]|uniref:ATP-binding cassette domain-containing protein n=1 Tax=Pseudidiomarina terrestris TaxID=2820060 RepID=A0AAW7R472_9GAMM|nr:MULTISPECIES: ATP-binding cassette domain-containing protein [unclassified Pseudidiomarina]MDN7125551.1 ATP-binding cassette domain-containing protein [Pseudidiomarina sp. 1APP75-32.1]MDN7126202.1 ATP-binding cassette domain-containing protein [Pseudidiomarina sp. 1APR75-33.1]MDN7130586.1 ATP-binding cassette domain-containing protein [Pseudidiomarina sp. 1APR75-15]MDN7137085.1 ATP-binding cassette domain-containing protein [Pseudidiomarina sp. 1ASP75-14]MEA3588345.1 ATP-binding cassette do
MYVEVNNVTKEYATVRAVDQVSLVAKGGEILALLGPNGAGKSSLVRMMVGLTQPDSGQIVYRSAADQQPLTALPSTAFGYLPEDRGLYQERTVLDNLRYIARLRGVHKTTAEQSIQRWLDRFELTDRASEPMRQLSKGNQQKIQLIATLLHEPQVVMLDEPFSGLDPMNQEFVLSVLNDLRSTGTTVILSAHQMALVERMANKLVLMNKGAVIAQGSLAEVRQQLVQQQRLQVEFTQSVQAEQISILTSVIEAVPLSDTRFELTCDDQLAADKLLMQLQDIAPVAEFSPQRQALHDLYLQAVRAEVNS